MKTKKTVLCSIGVVKGTLLKQLFTFFLTICSMFLCDRTAMAGCGATPVPAGSWHSVSLLCSERDAPYCAMASMSQACMDLGETVPTSYCVLPNGNGGWDPVYDDCVPTYSPGSCAG